MPLNIDLGSGASLELITEGDLAKQLRAGLDTVVNLRSLPGGLLNLPVAQVPAPALGTRFSFTTAPSWTIPQGVGITLSVRPDAACKLMVVKPGEALFRYIADDDGGETSIQAPEDRCYVGVELECSLALDAGAKWSSGNFGVSGSASLNDSLRVANYSGVAPSTPVRDAIRSALSRFVLPFHAASIGDLPDGDYIDFDFVGKLALGFGATYGFAGTFLGGRSNGEVQQSFASPVGKVVVSAAPSFQAGAGFKLRYTHEDAFRVVAGRVRNTTTNGATLYLLRRDASTVSTTETVGITLNAGAKFNADAGVVKSEGQAGAERLLHGAAGVALGQRLAGAAGALVGDINNSVNGLLAKGDGHKIALELIQSRARENTALFIYDFDFNNGTGAYDCAMQGDYAKAVTMPGVQLDPRSFVERLYMTRAGLNLQFFDVLRYQDVTDYVQKSEVCYVGARTFQLRDTVAVKAVSGLFGKERKADLYFIGQCRNVAGAPEFSDVKVRLNAVFVDTNNRQAASQTVNMMAALGMRDAADALRGRLAQKPDGAVQLTVDVDAELLSALKSTDYLPNGKPPKEPHPEDKRNYEQFVQAVKDVIGTQEPVARLFEMRFGRYEDWLEFNRAVTDQPGSTKPGDRLSVGNANMLNWPTGYPPREISERRMVQHYILAGQHFMNFSDGLKRLASALPDVDTEAEYNALLVSIAGMIREETPFPTYFFKPGMAALVKLADITLAPAGVLPDPAGTGTFEIVLKPAAAAAAGRGSV